VWAAVAIHPNDAARDSDLSGSLAVVAELAHDPVVRAIGETGLDYYRTPREAAAGQHESFRAHIDIARQTGKALMIHDRDAHTDVISTLLDYGAPDTVVFHCFSGDVAMARECARHGWYMSFGGVITFANAQPLRDALVEVPDELLLTETDAPFLTPTPMRGRANSSALLPYTVEAMAKVKGVSLDTLCERLFSNAARVFGPL
jgi:TatD DNase family protein